MNRLQREYPGLSFESDGHSFHVLLPKGASGGDGLANIFDEFAGYVRDRSTFPEYENSNLLAKYYVTTTAVAMARAQK